MGIFRRSGSTPGDEPVAGLDGESGETVEEQWPLGPTGRPLHPVGAYFEAAFRRFGINFTGYLAVTLNGASDITVIHSGSMPSAY